MIPKIIFLDFFFKTSNRYFPFFVFLDPNLDFTKIIKIHSPLV